MGKKDIIPTLNAHNILTTGTVVKGEIHAEEDFRFDGKIEGNITCKGKIVIGADADVLGDINCTNVDVLGKVSGVINCLGTLALRSTAVVKGNLNTHILEIEAGSQFEGSIAMIDKNTLNI
jgi:cytoskeletal protein CcmA (bactofilin family)